MKTWKQCTLVAVIIIFGIMLVGCDMELKPIYTVWTDSLPYYSYLISFGSLADGYYSRYELTSYEWNSISQSLTNEGKHNWTESEIKDWFIGRGFGNSEANREVAWLKTIDHGFIASRSGSIVHMLLK